VFGEIGRERVDRDPGESEGRRGRDESEGRRRGRKRPGSVWIKLFCKFDIVRVIRGDIEG